MYFSFLLFTFFSTAPSHSSPDKDQNDMSGERDEDIQVNVNHGGKEREERFKLRA